jgi:hypothetical protein
VLDEIDPWSLLGDEEASAHTTAVATAGKGNLSPSSARNRNPVSDFSQTSKPAANRRSISASQRRPVNPSATSGNSFNNTMGASSLASSLSSFAPGDSLGANGDASRTPSSSYDPEGFMGFIKLKAGLRATEIVDERDLAKLTAKIAAELGKKTDWEARTNALISLQKLAWGNLTDFKQSVDLIKGMHDLVSLSSPLVHDTYIHIIHSKLFIGISSFLSRCRCRHKLLTCGRQLVKKLVKLLLPWHTLCASSSVPSLKFGGCI